jgi:hypothetical protein
LARRLFLVVVMAVVLAGCSGSSTTPALPAGWKTVSYHGIGVDVPASWRVEPWRATCGVQTPIVFLGPAGVNALGCPSTAFGAQVVLGAQPWTGPGVHYTAEHINGLRAQVLSQYAEYHGTLGATVTTVLIFLPTKDMNISVSVADSARAPGGAPGRAEQIANTIHAVQ